MENENKSGFIKELPMETQKILKSTDFPVTRKDIIVHAKKSGVLSNILREIGMLPDREYNSAEDVARELHMVYMGVPA
jgi:hypothetical protein